MGGCLCVHGVCDVYGVWVTMLVVYFSGAC
jgi:hypothetical protein